MVDFSSSVSWASTTFLELDADLLHEISGTTEILEIGCLISELGFILLPLICRVFWGTYSTFSFTLLRSQYQLFTTESDNNCPHQMTPRFPVWTCYRILN
ncbi:hypothetical protein BDN72DRAFT_834746 [Pluteus cervinus]|uniref:Uncharacterized protein n=1 Tax=Pluteus cervinus TaxID=181527 RepID=A0ACD3B5T0_9AGAR|nr:hypothetical protein BDN72DRAFT_834746 [Pluteus cervinus]